MASSPAGSNAPATWGYAPLLCFGAFLVLVAAWGWLPAAFAQQQDQPQDQPQDQQQEQEPEQPLYRAEPFDRIVLDEDNDNAVLRVMPIDFPNRRVPDPRPAVGSLTIRLVGEPETEYELDWRAVTEIKLFDELVLDEANRLVEAGRLDEAYDYFQFLRTTYPNVPNLEGSIQNYLRVEAATFLQKKDFESALAMLRELFRRNPDMPGLENALGVATQELVNQRIADDDYRTARLLLRNLAELYPEHAVVKQREEGFQAEAARLLEQGRRDVDEGRLREAHKAGRRLLHIWPDLPGGREFIDSVQSRYRRLVVGVTLPAVDVAPGQLHDWAARRASRLLCRALMEFMGPGTEGGKYECPVGQVEIEELGLRLAYRVDPSRSPAGLPVTGYDLGRQLLAMADPDDLAYRADWAGLLQQVSVEPEVDSEGRLVHRVRADLRRAHVRPHGLLRSVAVSSIGANASDETAAAGEYRLLEQSAEGAVFVLRKHAVETGSVRPHEIVERPFARLTDAIDALARREIHVLDRINPWDFDRVRAVDGVIIEPYAVPLVHCLVPNPNRPLPSRRSFRRALVYGIHRQAVLDHLTRGESISGCRVVSGPFSPGLSHDDPLDYAYDSSIAPRAFEPRLAIGLAEVAFREAAAIEKNKGVAWESMPEVVLAHPPHEIARTACRSIQRQLKLVGVPVVLRELEPGLPAMIPDDVDLLYAELAMWEPVVDARRGLGEGGLSGRCSAYMSLALRQLDQAADWAEVRGRLRRIHRLAHDEVSVVPLWQLPDHFAYLGTLEGVGSRPVTLYQDVEAWRPPAQYSVEEK